MLVQVLFALCLIARLGFVTAVGDSSARVPDRGWPSGILPKQPEKENQRLSDSSAITDNTGASRGFMSLTTGPSVHELPDNQIKFQRQQGAARDEVDNHRRDNMARLPVGIRQHIAKTFVRQQIQDKWVRSVRTVVKNQWPQDRGVQEHHYQEQSRFLTRYLEKHILANLKSVTDLSHILEKSLGDTLQEHAVKDKVLEKSWGDSLQHYAVKDKGESDNLAEVRSWCEARLREPKYTVSHQDRPIQVIIKGRNFIKSISQGLPHYLLALWEARHQTEAEYESSMVRRFKLQTDRGMASIDAEPEAEIDRLGRRIYRFQNPPHSLSIWRDKRFDYFVILALSDYACNVYPQLAARHKLPRSHHNFNVPDVIHYRASQTAVGKAAMHEHSQQQQKHGDPASEVQSLSASLGAASLHQTKTKGTEE